MNDKPTVSKTRTRRMKTHRDNAPRWHEPITTIAWLQILLLWAAMMTILHFGREVQVTGFTPGQRSPSTIIALIDFDTVDLSETELRREQAAENVPTVYLVDEAQVLNAQRTWTKLADRLRTIKQRTAGNTNLSESVTRDFADALDLMNLPSELEVLPALIESNQLERLAPVMEDAILQTAGMGILSTRARSRDDGVTSIQIGTDAIARPKETIAVPAQAAQAIIEIVNQSVVLPSELRSQVQILLEAILEPNLVMNLEQTTLNRSTARDAVEPVVITIREGTTIVEARARMTLQRIENLRLHNEGLMAVEDSKTLVFTLLGHGILLACAIGISVLLILVFAPDLFKKPGRLFLWFTLSCLSLLFMKALTLIIGSTHLLPNYMVRPLLPFAFAPLLAGILRGPVFAVAVGITTSMGLALAFGLHTTMSLAVFITGLTVTMVAVISTRAIRKRSNLFRAGLVIGMGQAVLVFAMGALQEVQAIELANQVAGGFLSGLLTSVLVLLLIPPFEVLFRITTDVRLLELSDMSHPLLTRLALEAPATYHHSLMVAHLGQTAAREIEADDLLVRVCAYYHDIGKMTKPEFFIENVHSQENPHDELSPSMSRLVIVSHVKEGVSMAQRAKLPQAIIDGIEQHHGTSVIQYFFHRARIQEEEKGASDASGICPEDFRYPGPKPQSAEMAILLLADSVEAASRTVDKSRPGQIEGLVEKIFKEKVNDGQLDECKLTFGELAQVRRSFIFTLNNMMHGRIAYPDQEENEG